MIAQTNLQTQQYCKCGEPLIGGRCVFCQPLIVEDGKEAELNQFRTLVRKFHEAVAWGARQVKNGKWPPKQETIDNYFKKVEEPLEAEYQRLLNSGYSYEELWQIMGRLDIVMSSR